MEEDRLLHKCCFFLVQKINKWIITWVKKLTHNVLLCLLDPILKNVWLLAKKIHVHSVNCTTFII
jgi:hypothetical protein